jgi:hypothetical protein
MIEGKQFIVNRIDLGKFPAPCDLSHSSSGEPLMSRKNVDVRLAKNEMSRRIGQKSHDSWGFRALPMVMTNAPVTLFHPNHRQKGQPDTYDIGGSCRCRFRNPPTRFHGPMVGENRCRLDSGLGNSSFVSSLFGPATRRAACGMRETAHRD